MLYSNTSLLKVVQTLILVAVLLAITPQMASAQDDSAIQHLSLKQLIQQSTTGRPLYSGSSVTTAAAPLGLSLVTMALKLSSATEKDPTRKRQADVLIGRLQRAADSLFYYANEEEKAFTRFLGVRLLHDSTASLKKTKEALYQRALRESTRVPLQSARLVASSLATVRSALPYCRMALLVDMGAGVHLLQASLEALLLHAQSNTILMLKTDRTRYDKERLALQGDGRKTSILVLQSIQSRLNGQ